MADSSPFTKPHCPFSDFKAPIRAKPIVNKGKSYSGILFKSVFLVLFLIVLPFIPSQAPEFISNQTILTKFWELLHLLFIGIAVAYGFLSRRNVESDIEIETHPIIENNTPHYVSKMLHVSSIFGDGYENPCGSDEKRMMHCRNSQHQYFEGENGVVCSHGGTVMDEQYKTELPISDDNFTDSVRYEGSNVVQAWNSEYYHSEPVVVLSQPNYMMGGESGEVVGYRPLGLPVRSLRSAPRDLDSPFYTNESDSSSGRRGSSESSSRSRNREFGDLGPSNLEQKFNHAAAAGSSSPILWQSRSRKIENEEWHGNANIIRPSHFRPLSVDETKFELLSSRSFQSMSSFSSQRSLYSSLDSISAENVNFQEEDVGNKKTSYGPCSNTMNFQEEDTGNKVNSHVSSSENINFQEEYLGKKVSSYGVSSENLTFQEEYMSSYGVSSDNVNFQEGHIEKKMTSYGLTSENLSSQGEYMGEKMTSYVPSDNMNFQEEYMRTLMSSYGDSLENVNLQEEDMGEKMSSYGSSENMHFQGEDMGRKKASYGSSLENLDFQEKYFGRTKTSCGISSENMNFQEEDMGGKKASPGSSSENLNLPEEYLGKRKISYGVSSENMKFQEEEIGRKKTHYGSSSENLNFQEKYLGKGKTSCGVSSENLNFQEKNMGRKKKSSESLNFQEKDMGRKKTYSGSSSENLNLQEEYMGKKKTSYEVSSENMNFQEDNTEREKISCGSSSEHLNFEKEYSGKKKNSIGASSRHGRMATKENYVAVSHPSHFRPMSVDKAQFESPSSWSLQSTDASSSRTSLYTSLDSVPSEIPDLQNFENFSGKKSSHGNFASPSSSSSPSPSPPGRSRMNGEASLKAFHSRGYSVGSLLEDNTKKSLKDELRGLDGIRGEDFSSNKVSGLHQSDPEKPPRPTKALSRGKSVRTRRPSLLTPETVGTGEIFNNKSDERMEKMHDSVKESLVRKGSKKKDGWTDHLLKGISKQNVDTSNHEPEAAFFTCNERDKREPSKIVSKEDSYIELENIQLSSDEDQVAECVSDSGLDSEVDKKASEFIAKFKEQIRLQKSASVERSRGLRLSTSGNYIR